MLQLSPVFLASALGLIHRSIAQYPPPVTYDSIIKSPIDPSITISYKSPAPGTCMTTFAKQKQYSGYINLPPYTLAPYQQNYTVNTFFWFFEARESPETAPLTIWLNGGPGSSSMIGLFGGIGPCSVVQLQDGTWGTQSNIWGWDRSSNVLFIDQPTQVGFSYDSLVNKSYDVLGDAYLEPPQPLKEGTPSWAFLNGTFSSGVRQNTQNTSMIAASASWHFLQGFLSVFSQYNPGTRPNRTTTEPTGINLFAESYGGQYGPAFAGYFSEQNRRRATGVISPNNTLEIKLASVGIISGLVDDLVQTPFYPKFAFNNTHGLSWLSQTDELNILSDFQGPGGCKEQATQCRQRMQMYDPQGEGDDDLTNKVCSAANDACNQVLGNSMPPGKSVYDIRIANDTSPFPSLAFLEYLSDAGVLKSIGAQVNFTRNSDDVYDAFSRTGDEVRGVQLDSLSRLLSSGVRVALINGDADFICNWYGGEAVSLELARITTAYQAQFPAAGYAPIIVNGSYIGGQARQYGNLSFARIYDAGHVVSSYQPETAFTVFSRIIGGKDLGTGQGVNLSAFGTLGPVYSDGRNKARTFPKSPCMVRAIEETCNKDEREKIRAGSGVVKNGIWYSASSNIAAPSSFIAAGRPGSLPPTSSTASATSPATTTSISPTGVFTATATPSSGASSLRPGLRFRLQSRQSPVYVLDTETRDHLKKGLIIASTVLGSLALLALIASGVLALMLFRGRHKDLKVDPTIAIPPKDVEKAEMPGVPPPVIDRLSMRPTASPLEPIYEQDVPGTASIQSADSRPATPPPGTPRRLSTHPNVPIDAPVSRKTSAIVPQASPGPSRRSSAAAAIETAPTPSRRASELSKESALHASRKPSDATIEPPPAPSRKSTEPPAESTGALSRKPSEATGEPSLRPSRKPSEVLAEPDLVLSRKPSDMPVDPLGAPSRKPSEAPTDSTSGPSRKQSEAPVEPKPFTTTEADEPLAEPEPAPSRKVSALPVATEEAPSRKASTAAADPANLPSRKPSEAPVELLASSASAEPEPIMSRRPNEAPNRSTANSPRNSSKTATLEAMSTQPPSPSTEPEQPPRRASTFPAAQGLPTRANTMPAEPEPASRKPSVQRRRTSLASSRRSSEMAEEPQNRAPEEARPPVQEAE